VLTVETYLFQGHAPWHVLPGCTCNIQMPDAISLTLECSEIMRTYNTPDTAVRDRRELKVMTCSVLLNWCFTVIFVVIVLFMHMLWSMVVSELLHS